MWLYSKVSMQWLNFLSVTLNIQHADDDNGEYRIPGTRYFVDGYCKDNNTIYEFLGLLHHSKLSKFK